MATYNVTITSKALKDIPDLCHSLVQEHRAFDPTTPLSAIKVIVTQLYQESGGYLYVGTGAANPSNYRHGPNQTNYRYMRVVIDARPGSKTTIDKKALLTRVMERCMDYQGKKAKDCEIEVRINEIKEEDMIRIDPIGV